MSVAVYIAQGFHSVVRMVWPLPVRRYSGLIRFLGVYGELSWQNLAYILYHENVLSENRLNFDIDVRGQSTVLAFQRICALSSTLQDPDRSCQERVIRQMWQHYPDHAGEGALVASISLGQPRRLFKPMVTQVASWWSLEEPWRTLVDSEWSVLFFTIECQLSLSVLSRAHGSVG